MALAKKTNGSDKIAASLYERDFYSWALEQARALLEHRTEDLDWDNLADEVGDLARSERRALRSQCARLIEHLLKIGYAPMAILESNRRLWNASVSDARSEINDLLGESPGLKPSVEELFRSAWEKGRNAVLMFLELPDEALPETPLWTFDHAMDENFNPGK
jgi:hypothetical protein